MRPRAQLRPTFACRSKTNTEEPNSVERGAHRRKAPVPVRVCFAGADARWGYVPPASLRSSEDSVRPRAQLRLGSSNRKKTNTEEPNSVEKGATGGRRQLLLGFVSPELVQAQNAHLRRAFVRRRTSSESARSSGQHSLAGGGRLPAPHFRRKDPSSEVARGLKKPTTMECGYYS